MISFDSGVTVEDIVSVAVDRSPVNLSDQTRQRIGAAFTLADALSARIPTYGRSTGVGANRLTTVDASDDAHGLRLLRSHATDAGKPVSPTRVRAMLAVRLAQLAHAGSGIRPDVVDGVVTMLNENALPTVLQRGSIGTADLTALAATALTLQGEWPASRPLTPMEPWGPESALAFMSSSALTIGRGCLALVELERALHSLITVYALTFIGLRGNPATFSPHAARAAAAPGAEDVAARIRALIGADVHEPARIQDPYGLRAFVVSTAPAWTANARLRSVLSALIDTAQENPLFVTEGDPEMVHHACFFQATLGLSVDALNLALAQTAPITFSRIRMMNEPDLTGLRPFLANGPVGASGTMMVEYVAADAAAQLRHAAQPASLGSVVLSRGAEEHASFATQAVNQLEEATDAFCGLLSCEIVQTARLLRQRGICAEDLPAALVGYAQLLNELPSDDQDRSLRGDLAAAQSLIDALGAPST